MRSIEKLLSCVKFAISNFLQWGSLKSHQKTHREERAFICELCNAQFNFSNSLKVHTNKNHGGSAGSNIHTCSICTKEFHSPGGLQRHEKAIHQGIRYPCSICPHEAKVKKELQVHKRRHMGEKQYSCNVCNKMTDCDCNTHKTRNHFSAQENIKCQFCNEEVRKHSFKQHVKFKHQSSTLDIQKCDKCDKGFGSKDRLKNHKKTHDNHKQFVCSVCIAHCARRGIIRGFI